MRIMIVTAVAAVCFVAAAYALPADLVVVSDKEVRPDEAAGFYYLGTCAAGYLYNGSSAAVGRAVPYHILDRDAQAKDYYIVWAPEWVAITPEAFAHLGTSVRLSEYEILVGLERGLGAGALRAVEHRIELIKLTPVTRVDWRADAEEPPTKKDPVIEAAVSTITEAEYAGYIKRLQRFETRYNGTCNGDTARDYIRDFFLTQYLEASLFPFPCGRIRAFCYPEKGYVVADIERTAPQRSRDYGVTWEKLPVWGIDSVAQSLWLDGDVGFIAGHDGNLAKTVTGGATWEILRFGTSAEEKYQPLFLFFVNADVGWLGGEVYRGTEFVRTFLKKTENGGRTWTGRKPTGDFHPRVVSFYDDRHGWVSGTGGVFYTNDGGATWRETSLPWAAAGLAATGPKEGWAALGYTGLWRTADGVAWTRADTGFEGDFDIVAFPTAARGYAAGDKLLTTRDGGRTWREIRNAPPLPLDSLAFADEDNGAVESSHRMYLTDDGGASFEDITDNIDLEGENVIGERRGSETPDEIVIIGGHYDSTAEDCGLYDAPGADDNASGTACVMAAARAFRNASFKRTVRYIAFGAEEWGVVGSQFYAEECARRGENIVAVINVDMVCYDEEKGARDDFAIDCGEFDAFEWLLDYVRAVSGFYGNGLIYESGILGCDDRRFRNEGYAAIGVIEGEVGPGGSSEYRYAHSNEDTFDKLHPALGVRVCRDLAATLAHLAGVGDYAFEREPAGKAATPFARPFAVYPNPYCYATAAGGVNFVGIKSPATVEIYDLAGRRVGREEVAAGCDECVWRPAVGGETPAPGVYLYRVEGQGQKEAGKVVIVR